ncbi:hypothetical protein EDB83DRAFT_2322358 [Lactarius deliciosus]|nr:hypothetical protein EDB83DRAFT_2322358 [Lactarius deliciosus]
MTKDNSRLMELRKLASDPSLRRKKVGKNNLNQCGAKVQQPHRIFLRQSSLSPHWSPQREICHGLVQSFRPVPSRVDSYPGNSDGTAGNGEAVILLPKAAQIRPYFAGSGTRESEPAKQGTTDEQVENCRCLATHGVSSTVKTSEWNYHFNIIQCFKNGLLEDLMMGDDPNSGHIISYPILVSSKTKRLGYFQYGTATPFTQTPIPAPEPPNPIPSTYPESQTAKPYPLPPCRVSSPIVTIAAGSRTCPRGRGRGPLLRPLANCYLALHSAQRTTRIARVNM